MSSIEQDMPGPTWALANLVSRAFLAPLFAMFGALLCGTALSLDHFGGTPGLGTMEQALLLGGTASLGLATLIRHAFRGELTQATKFIAISAQIVLLFVVFRTYQLESESFYGFVFALVLSGFLANYFLPATVRMPFFLGLSLVGMFGIFGLINGLLMLSLGLALIMLCHLPVALWVRVGLMLAAMVGLGLVRYGTIDGGRLNVILPTFASIFMFRLAIYLYDITTGKGPTGWWSRLSYFFMLPNFVFPFFPVVDFAGWGRSYYAGEELDTYQRGAVWIFYGCLHLLLYRFVNYYLVIDPTEVTNFGGFLHYIIANFGLYLKISGLFHLILGCLYLFGFALPETHSRFYLSNGFIDFWRRINIYWKDFMQKVVFNPAYTRLKRAGLNHLQAAVLAIVAVFFCTWALHSYQWFWLLGTVMYSWPDTLFWALLAALLIFQTLFESQPIKPGATALISARTLWVIRTVATSLTIVNLWALWSSETMDEYYTLLGAAGFSVLDPAAPLNAQTILQSAAFAALFLVLVAFAIGFTFGLAPRGSLPKKSTLGAKRKQYDFARHAWFVGIVTAAIVAIQVPALYGALPRNAQTFVVNMRLEHLSTRDQAKLERGYYENLTDVRSINSALWATSSKKPANWQQIREMDAIRFTGDYLEYEFLPNVTTTYKGALFSTNAHGMRDQEYSLMAPADTRRIAIVGASRAMGSGVADGETFEAILEATINANHGQSVEILNFAVADYEPARRLISLERKVWDFSPEVVFYIAHRNDVDVRHLIANTRAGIPRPFDFLDDALDVAGVTHETEPSEARRRLRPYGSEFAGAVYQKFADDVRQRGAIPVWVYLPSAAAYSGPDPVVQQLRDKANQAGLTVLDLAKLYEHRNMDALWLAPWDHHPNNRGHQIIAEALYDQILTQPALKSELGLGQE